MEQWILDLVQNSPNMAYLAVFGVLLACGLGVPMPEDITLIAGGYTVYIADINNTGSPSLIPMIIVGMVGVLLGDTILFLAGRWLGPKATRIWPFRKLFSPKRLERTRSFFKKYGGWTAFFARFAAGFRAPTYLLAGSMGMRFRTFLLCDGSAALISVPLLIWLAWNFGAQINQVKEWLSKSKYALAAVFVVLGIYIVVRVVLARRRKRREAEARVESDDGPTVAVAADADAGDAETEANGDADGHADADDDSGDTEAAPSSGEDGKSASESTDLDEGDEPDDDGPRERN